MLKEGYTHRLWVPKTGKRFLEGSILHSLPRGAVDMAQSWELDTGTKHAEDK